MPAALFVPNMVGVAQAGASGFGDAFALALQTYGQQELKTWKELKGLEASAQQIAQLTGLDPDKQGALVKFGQAGLLSGGDPLAVQGMMFKFGLEDMQAKRREEEAQNDFNRKLLFDDYSSQNNVKQAAAVQAATDDSPDLLSPRPGMQQQQSPSAFPIPAATLDTPAGQNIPEPPAGPENVPAWDGNPDTFVPQDIIQDKPLAAGQGDVIVPRAKQVQEAAAAQPVVQAPAQATQQAAPAAAPSSVLLPADKNINDVFTRIAKSNAGDYGTARKLAGDALVEWGTDRKRHENMLKAFDGIYEKISGEKRYERTATRLEEKHELQKQKITKALSEGPKVSDTKLKGLIEDTAKMAALDVQVLGALEGWEGQNPRPGILKEIGENPAILRDQPPEVAARLRANAQAARLAVAQAETDLYRLKDNFAAINSQMSPAEAASMNERIETFKSAALYANGKLPMEPSQFPVFTGAGGEATPPAQDSPVSYEGSFEQVSRELAKPDSPLRGATDTKAPAQGWEVADLEAYIPKDGDSGEVTSSSIANWFNDGNRRVRIAGFDAMETDTEIPGRNVDQAKSQGFAHLGSVTKLGDKQKKFVADMMAGGGAKLYISDQKDKNGRDIAFVRLEGLPTKPYLHEVAAWAGGFRPSIMVNGPFGESYLELNRRLQAVSNGRTGGKAATGTRPSPSPQKPALGLPSALKR